MSVIRMETEVVAALVQKMQRCCLEIDQEIDRLKQVRVKVQIHWLGDGAPVVFEKSLNQQMKTMSSSTLELEKLKNQLSLELQQWVEVDGNFKGATFAVGALAAAPVAVPTLTIAQLQERMCGALSGKEQDRCLLIWGSPPTTAEQLAFMIRSLPASMPIVIMQIGPGEYLVLMRGTTSGGDEGSNWGSAVEAMFGNSSYQNSVVDALNKANLPPNAKLHFAGHSQGGMIAQNLAVDPRVLRQFDVETVTMFGSPDTFSLANKNVRYVSFEAPGDIVPWLDTIVESILIPMPGSQIPRLNDVSAMAERHIILNSVDAYIPIPKISHAVYDKPGVLANQGIPFEAKSWDGVTQQSSQVSTLGPVIYKKVVEGKESLMSTVDQAKAAAKEVVRQIESMGVI